MQSRLVTCEVAETQALLTAPALADLDYAISDTLSLEQLARVPEHDLSLMVNGGEGSHQFRFYASDGGKRFVNDASIQAAAVEDLIDRARGALRQAAWGTREVWKSSDRYRYRDATVARQHLEADLIGLAKQGRSLYVGIVNPLAGGVTAKAELERRARVPGRVQIATAESGLYVPANLFYDHSLETAPGTAHRGSYVLCEDFRDALANGALEHLVCFTEGCQGAEDPFSVTVSETFAVAERY